MERNAAQNLTIVCCIAKGEREKRPFRALPYSEFNASVVERRQTVQHHKAVVCVLAPQPQEAIPFQTSKVLDEIWVKLAVRPLLVVQVVQNERKVRAKIRVPVE